MRSSSLGFAAIIGKVVKGIIVLFAVAFILIFLLAWFLNNRSDEYTKQEVTEGIQDIVVKYIEENEGLFAPDFKIELWNVENYSWNGRPNLCQVVWTISINEGKICVMKPIAARGVRTKVSIVLL